MDLRAVVDLETTGLRPGFILEIACVVVDDAYEVQGDFHKIIRPAGWGDKWMLDQFDEVALNMHRNNGLIDEVYNGTDEEVVCSDFCNFLKRMGEPPNIQFMGNSIGKVDLPFLQARMPRVFDHVHYRSIDVSGVRFFLKSVLGQDYKYPKSGGHRAMGDVLECIEEAKYLSNIIAFPRVLLEEALDTLEKHEGPNGDNYVKLKHEYEVLDVQKAL